MTQAEDALLCRYYRERDEAPVCIEDLERTYPRIPRERLVSLERKGLISHVQPAGYRITPAGIEAYLSDL